MLVIRGPRVEAVSNAVFGVPLVTRTLVFLSLVFYIVSFAASSLSSWACLSAQHVLEPQRLLLYSVVHLSLWHLLFNMFALLPLASRLERQLGTFSLLFLVVASTVFAALFYVSLSASIRWFHAQCAAGASGLIFSLAVIDALAAPGVVVLLGCFRVNKIMAPVFLLALLSFVPNVSFLGHLAGMAAGAVSWFAWLHVLPSLEAVKGAVEANAVGYPGFSLGGEPEGEQAPAAAAVHGGVPVADAGASPFDFLQRAVLDIERRIAAGRRLLRQQQEPNDGAEQQQQQQQQGIRDGLLILMEMGFEREIALDMLRRANGNVEQALLMAVM